MKISFFTPIIYIPSDNCQISIKEKLLNTVERYFVLNKTQGLEVKKNLAVDETITDITKDKIVDQNSTYPKVFTALKIISYMTLVVPAIMLLAKFILRSICHTNHLELTPWLFSKMPSISKESTLNPTDIDTLNQKKVENSLKILCDTLEGGFLPQNIKGLGFSHNCIFFAIKDLNHLKFSAVRNSFFNPLSPKSQRLSLDNRVIQEQFERYIEIKKHMNNRKSTYPNLILPKQKLFKIPHRTGEKLFLIEELISPYRTDHSSLVWKNKDTELQPAFKQLSILSKDKQIYWATPDHCLPICNKDGIWSLVITNLEQAPRFVKNADPHTGDENLIKHLFSQESMRMIFDKAYDTQQPRLKHFMHLQKKNLARLHRLEKFYAAKGKNPYTPPCPFQVNDTFLNSLKLNLNETTILSNRKTITMKEAVVSFLDHLNSILQSRIWTPSTYTHRIFYYPVHAHKTLINGLEKATSRGTFLKKAENLWIRKILNALMDAKIISSWNVSDNDTFNSWLSCIEIWI